MGAKGTLGKLVFGTAMTICVLIVLSLGSAFVSLGIRFALNRYATMFA